jgi:acetyl esterase/lipase
MRRLVLRLAAVLFFAATAAAQQPDWQDQIGFTWRIDSNVVYRTAGGHELKLDVYAPMKPASSSPVVIYFHGGGWVDGTKEVSLYRILPYLELGLPVVNADYRTAKFAPAPAAVEDCRCALRWVVRNAEKYHFDPKRIIVTGSSAGSHLALMTGMLRAADGFDRSCRGGDFASIDRSDPSVAAIINWWGITDVADLLENGSNPRNYAIEWIGNRDDAAALAKRLSPISYVRAGLPPILTIHGDADTVVPPSHATRFHDALQKAGAQSQLVLLHGADHGVLTPDQVRTAHDAGRAFLKQHGLLP